VVRSAEKANSEVLVLRHVPWEGLGAFAEGLDERGEHWRYVDVFTGVPIPDLTHARAVFIMGGPMGVYEADRYPFLSAELAAIQQAVRIGTPVLGICLGSELLAAALGASVRLNPVGKEIGWRPISPLTEAASDPIFCSFRGEEVVLHWHSDIFELPEGAVALAASSMTPCQAFRWGPTAWGMLFHVEADLTLVQEWLNHPTMRDEAAAIDPQLPQRIVAETPQHQSRLADLRAAILDGLLAAAEACETRG
jgi:GMP synthase (glutamine-hydrolysing)